MKYIKFNLLLIVVIIAMSFWYAFPLQKRINLGLDLQGGMHLVLKVDTSKLSKEAKKDAAERALEIIRNRIDEFGVKEPAISRQGEDEIVVQLPGITDRKRALDLIGQTAVLEFKLVNSDPTALKDALEGKIPEGYELKYLEKEPLILEKEASITGEYLVDAGVQFDQAGFGEPIVAVKFNAEGAKKFADITASYVGRRLAIILDGHVKSAPRINEPIPSGEGVITGRFTIEEANDLAIALRVGALPAPINIEEERTVGPLLGQDSINSGVKASIIGCVGVFGFMILYYLFAGFIACIALMLNFLIILGAMGMFHATLTLPGIAGIVLTLGMAVDANVLISERIREELRAGKSLRIAINNGYQRAFSAIFDSNVTTLIAAALLFQFGTGPIRGFALTLTIGLLASLYTAVIVTHLIFEVLLNSRLISGLPMLQIFKEKPSIDFIGKRKIFYTISVLIILLGMGSVILRGKNMLGIELSGGQLQEYKFEQPVAIGDIRAGLKGIGIDEASIQQFKDFPNNISIRTNQDTFDKVSANLSANFPDNKFEILKIEKIGPSIGKQLRKRAILAIFWSLLGILIYVAFRFKHFNFAIAGVIALLHDIFMAVGFIALTGRQIDLLMVTAFLTIAGYSINDTIVIYDRVREVSRSSGKITLAQAINQGVNLTLSRTILTSFVTLLVVFSLFFFGGEVLNGFAFCLIVGFFSGIYSTIFIASPLVLAWQKK
ncbi:MAG: protein translocase subunit SecD [Candidatus Omnitrophota bacterium]